MSICHRIQRNSWADTQHKIKVQLKIKKRKPTVRQVSSIKAWCHPRGATPVRFRLEAELRSEPEMRRELEDRSGAVERIRRRRNTRRSAIDLEGIILPNCLLVVESIEPISGEPQFLAFAYADRIVGSQVKVPCERCTHATR